MATTSFTKCPTCGHGVLRLIGRVNFRLTFDGMGGLVCKRDPCRKDIEKILHCAKCRHRFAVTDFCNFEFLEAPFWCRPPDC